MLSIGGLVPLAGAKSDSEAASEDVGEKPWSNNNVTSSQANATGCRIGWLGREHRGAADVEPTKETFHATGQLYFS